MIKSLQLECQYLQIMLAFLKFQAKFYDSLLQQLAWKFQEDHHNFADIEAQAKSEDS